MDVIESGGAVRRYIPRYLLWPVVVGILWTPSYYAIHVGQITPILALLFALGINQKPFVRGLIVGFAAAIKTPFAVMLPFVGYSFGFTAAIGMAAGMAPVLMYPDYLMEYVHQAGRIAGRHYNCPGLVGLVGYRASAVMTVLACGWISWIWRGRESSYLGILAVTVIGTALWWHSYTPLVVPAVWFLSRYLKRREHRETIGTLDSRR